MAHSDVRGVATLCMKLRDERTSREHRGSVENDPKRHFATVNCRIAKGSFNRVVGDGKHVGSRLDAERSRRVQVDDEREFGRSGNLARRTFNRHRYF
jgi:hypothetical protein